MCFCTKLKMHTYDTLCVQRNSLSASGRIDNTFNVYVRRVQRYERHWGQKLIMRKGSVMTNSDGQLRFDKRKTNKFYARKIQIWL